MSSFFNKNLPRACKYCVYGKDSVISGEVLCSRHGVTLPGDSCGHYRYGPLRREPQRAKIAGNYKPEDFSL